MKTTEVKERISMHDDICIKCGDHIGSQSNTDEQIFKCFTCWKGEQQN